MAKRMLIDATHPEETRVVVVNGTRLEEFDFETSTKKQLKGNIYLAKVTRVEPSLQAAFVEYGGNRHGFLAFNEIHPDYWRIPIADREALLAEDDDQDEEPRNEHRRRGRRDRREEDAESASEQQTEPAGDPGIGDDGDGEAPPLAALTQDLTPRDGRASDPDETPPAAEDAQRALPLEAAPEPTLSSDPLPNPASFADAAEPPRHVHADLPASDPLASLPAPESLAGPQPIEVPPAADLGPTSLVGSEAPPAEGFVGSPEPAPPEAEIAERAAVASSVESLGGDEVEEVRQRRRFRQARHYKIQEVIKRRQVLLVQVVKEERGNKGAALTTYLSLAGRYCVLMPNTARGGGISRRITSTQDRKRLKNIIEELDVPDGMAVILRTAGMERSKPEIKRDYEYLMRLWDDVRELTLKSVAPAAVYEEGTLIKRAIRDLYSSEIDEILVEGADGYRIAREFMAMLMPSAVERIKLYDDPSIPLFQRYQVETQLDEMHSNTVRLRSGGYIVINPTEALVAIDVNSGRATRERHIEETAYKTNLEAADEIARQLRLRDLAGLIVIDFIDMEDHRYQHQVERRLKEAMKSDRARIQIGRISPFGLLELSRQRLRPSLQEVSSQVCPHCGGSGVVRSTESSSLHILRSIEEEAMKQRAVELTVQLPPDVAIYLFNNKRAAVASIESRFGVRIVFTPDASLIQPDHRIERTRMRGPGELPPPGPVRHVEEPEMPAIFAPVEDVPAAEREPELAAPAATGEEARPPREGDGEEDGEGGRRRRRRRRRRGRRGDGAPGEMRAGPEAHEGPDGDEAPGAVPDVLAPPLGEVPGAVAGPENLGPPSGFAPEQPQGGEEDGSRRRRRRRGRRGGRHHGDEPIIPPEVAVPEAPPVLIGPGHDLDRPYLAPPSRIEGPGDAHDWPWNRRAERFPDEPPEEIAPVTPRPSAPPPVAETAPPGPVLASPAVPPPLPVAQAAPEPPAASPAPPPEPEPQGPPKRGWWKRLTGGPT
ncbi:MAG: Rne/Rng family ribonuclease [Alphaproteobacteria bacterium]|nr:Rne/Rng family ribonuclease [Alphaproteobacteria bacterium]